MGKKKSSLPGGGKPAVGAGEKKSKKRQRESDAGGARGAAAKEKRRSSSSRGGGSKEVVIRRAPQDSVSPVVVSFANQTVPQDMGAFQFAMHQGCDEGKEGQRVVMGEGARCVNATSIDTTEDAIPLQQTTVSIDMIGHLSIF